MLGRKGECSLGLGLGWNTICMPCCIMIYSFTMLHHSLSAAGPAPCECGAYTLYTRWY